MKRVIITGDDFGLALPVNQAIAEAHQKGILTTASLMVGAAFASDAVERARQCPSLKVGLHLTLVEGYSVLPQRAIPDLVDADGAFPTRLAQAGFKFFFYPGIRKQLEAEIRAQFEAFRKTGFELDHVNAHNHMHLHPTILRLILKIGRDYGLKAVRLPNEPPIKSWRAAGTYPASRISSWLFLRPWMVLMKILLNQAQVRFNDFLFGMTDGGCMKRDLVERFMHNLPDGVTELCFHPATGRCAEIDRTMPRYHHEEEFRALTCEALRNLLQTSSIQTIAFSDL
ncbi:MAG: hopanoid biosynthesis-associated protein HpnK [Acidobacteriota bacterium]|nr:hopanoid biosynthesis-associated protein HpnK [Acidobacteriota bacterium]